MIDLLNASAFTLWGAPTTWLELIAFALALAMVGLNIRANPWGWPIAIASSLLYVVVFAKAKLYGDAALQVFFAAMALWGWWQWLRGTTAGGQALRVHRLPPRSNIKIIAISGLLTLALGGFLQKFTDTDVPWLDAVPTALSVVGTVLLARKYLANWAVWVVVNVLSVGLYAYKGLWLTTALYAVFIALSVVGYRAWARQLARSP